MSMTSAPVVPCSCAEGWKPEGWAYCAECYEGQIERLREQLADTKDDYLRRHRDACDKWEALMDIRLVANEPGDRRALIDKIFGIATKALRPIQEASRYASPVGKAPKP